MTNTPTAAFRLPEQMLERLDLYAQRLSAETGLTVTRTDVVRKLLNEALDRVQPNNVRDAAMDARDRQRHLDAVRDPSRGRRRPSKK
ncbi:MAG: hypothetical protein ABR567_09500 [Myxococcales bacterium]